MKVILITGASSGMGYYAAQQLAARGHRVYGAARRTALMEPLRAVGVVPLQMDITHPDEVQAAVEAVIAAEGRIDVLFNNAGYGSFGAVEDVPADEARRQLDVNLVGLADMTRRVLPHMRAQGGGLIVNTGSVAGRMPFHFGSWYNVTKYAVRAMTDAMRLELKSFGIKVVLVEPGPIATAWGDIAATNLEHSAEGGAYREAAKAAATGLRHLYAARWLTRPEQVARTLVRIAEARHPRRRYPVGVGARAMMALHALLPPALYDRVAVGLMSKL